jgi:hypothetical protein
VKGSWSWLRWPRLGPIDSGGWNSLLLVELQWRRSPSVGSFIRLEAHVVVVHADTPELPLVHWLAHSIVVRPPDKHAVALGGGWCPITVSPAAVV